MHFVRELYLKGMITVHKIDTEDEIADIFTKALPKGTNDFYKFRDYIMNV